ncbi:hypothetical protein KL86DES1_20503 [uncultured Desulfovibrio sp.]|uniref:Uncharacterized protein n=1 Tax=uncultured Desulfovibrio sp. TaxID=167968 RepID=A0A212L431_9BACT|nr:hypothetical protein KL86DES1_20503 [uncultured Desulfovibrio sp.]VZH33406.1 conserved protein of unknown function [Desulfovibrio sp. 86]
MAHAALKRPERALTTRHPAGMFATAGLAAASATSGLPSAGNGHIPAPQHFSGERHPPARQVMERHRTN